MNERATESVQQEDTFRKKGQTSEWSRGNALSFLTGILNGPSRLANNESLIVSQPNDADEIEAERVADCVSVLPLNSAFKQSAPQISSREHPAGTSDHVSDVLGGSGSPLEPGLRLDMEQRLGHDFSKVRVYSGQPVGELDVSAYTIGNNVVFGASQYELRTQADRRLIAHELTHVAQQSPEIKIRRGPNSPAPPTTPSPPVWLGSLGTGAVWVQGEIWEVDVQSLGGKVWVGPYGQLQDYINKQGFSGIMEAAHIVGGEHLDDVGSAFSYNNAPCVAVDKSLHAYWTDNTTKLQVDYLGGRSTVSAGRTIITSKDAVWLYQELYDAHPELQRISRTILNLPGRDPAGNMMPKPTRVMPPAGSPMDAYQGQGSPMARTGSPMDVYEGSPLPKTGGSPMDVHQPFKMPKPGSPMDVHEPFKMPKPVVGVEPGPDTGGGVPPTSGSRAGLRAGGGAAAHSALSFGAELVGAWVRGNQLERELKNRIYPAIEAEMVRQGDQLLQLQIENYGTTYYWNITIETGTTTGTMEGTGTGLNLPELKSVAISTDDKHAEKSKNKCYPGFCIETTTTTYSVPAGSISIDQAALYGRLTGMKLDKLREQAVAGRDAANMPDQYEQWSNLVETIDADDLDLVIRAQTGRLPADVIRKYLASKADQAQLGVTTGGPRKILIPPLSKRSAELQALVDAPFEELITFTKRWGNAAQLSRLRSYAVNQGFLAGSTDSKHWSDMVAATEAPLDDEMLADRQRLLWSQGPSTEELEEQRATVNSLEDRVNELEQQLDELSHMDGRTQEELDAGEPPHPPWARMLRVKQEITRIREDLSVERRLLKDDGGK